MVSHTSQLTIRVLYPLLRGRIVLRADSDWTADIEAAEVSDDRTVYVFRLKLAGPFSYFKPCIVDGTELFWSKGKNYLAIAYPDGRENRAEASDAEGAEDAEETTKDIYPHFFDDLAGTISPLIEVPTEPSSDQHKIRIYFPPGYRENTLKCFPVLYMHDGTNLFFPDEAFIGEEWQVDETMDLLDAMNIIKKAIVVGVYPNDRMREYTKPGYETYGRSIVEQLKPAIDGTFRTLQGPENTAVMGSSLGGVVSLYLAWQWPEVFGKVACMSSTFGLLDDLLARISREEKREIQIYLDSGWPGDNFEVTVAMRDLLLGRGYSFGKNLLYFAFPQALHSEKYWAMRSHIPYQFFFGNAPVFT
jgi:predicted alpha/beta superfamily hydrolase